MGKNDSHEDIHKSLQKIVTEAYTLLAEIEKIKQQVSQYKILVLSIKTLQNIEQTLQDLIKKVPEIQALTLPEEYLVPQIAALTQQVSTNKQRLKKFKQEYVLMTDRSAIVKKIEALLLTLQRLQKNKNLSSNIEKKLREEQLLLESHKQTLTNTEIYSNASNEEKDAIATAYQWQINEINTALPKVAARVKAIETLLEKIVAITEAQYEKGYALFTKAQTTTARKNILALLKKAAPQKAKFTHFAKNTPIIAFKNLIEQQLHEELSLKNLKNLISRLNAIIQEELPATRSINIDTPPETTAAKPAKKAQAIKSLYEVRQILLALLPGWQYAYSEEDSNSIALINRIHPLAKEALVLDFQRHWLTVNEECLDQLVDPKNPKASELAIEQHLKKTLKENNHPEQLATFILTHGGQNLATVFQEEFSQTIRSEVGNILPSNVTPTINWRITKGKPVAAEVTVIIKSFHDHSGNAYINKNHKVKHVGIQTADNLAEILPSLVTFRAEVTVAIESDKPQAKLSSMRVQCYTDDLTSTYMTSHTAEQKLRKSP